VIEYLKHDEIDTEKWDACISKSVNGLIYARSWYLDLVNDKWEGLVMNDYEAVMPLTPGRKLGVDYLFQPRFTQQLGVFSRSHLTEKVVNRFLKAIPEKYKFIEICLNTHNIIRNSDKYFRLWKTHEIDLINDYDKIQKEYSTNLKRNLKKAENFSLQIVENIKPENVIKIFRETSGKKFNHLQNQDYDLLRRMIYVMIYKRTARVVGVFDEMNTLCAGAFFVFSGKKIIFFFSAANHHARDTGAMPFLIDDFIKKHTGQHYTLDFEGSNDANLARFYKSFGAGEVYYHHYKISYLNPILNGLLAIKKRVAG
jgi:hypothetical protein